MGVEVVLSCLECCLLDGDLEALLGEGVHVIIVLVRGHWWGVGRQSSTLCSGPSSSLCSQQIQQIQPSSTFSNRLGP